MTEVLRSLDTDQNGTLTAAETRQAKIIVYGHSWGASEAVAFAKELERLKIPVLLTIQIDIVPKPGRQPILIPSNVEAAVNFFQSERATARTIGGRRRRSGTDTRSSGIFT